MYYATYPRKGTETHSILESNSKKSHYNLSPQGDGNSIELILAAYVEITTYPRKGTVTPRLPCQICNDGNYNLSPQGDGNFVPLRGFSGLIALQLIPARGRKLPAGYVHDRVHDITAYPRKGTVTLSVSSEEQVSENYNLSLQNPLRRCAPALPKGELFQLPLPCTKLPLRGSWHGASRD